MVDFSGAALQKWKFWGAVFEREKFVLRVLKSRLVF